MANSNFHDSFSDSSETSSQSSLLFSSGSLSSSSFSSQSSSFSSDLPISKRQKNHKKTTNLTKKVPLKKEKKTIIDNKRKNTKNLARSNNRKKNVGKFNVVKGNEVREDQKSCGRQFLSSEDKNKLRASIIESISVVDVTKTRDAAATITSASLTEKEYTWQKILKSDGACGVKMSDKTRWCFSQLIVELPNFDKLSYYIKTAKTSLGSGLLDSLTGGVSPSDWYKLSAFFTDNYHSAVTHHPLLLSGMFINQNIVIKLLKRHSQGVVKNIISITHPDKHQIGNDSFVVSLYTIVFTKNFKLFQKLV